MNILHFNQLAGRKEVHGGEEARGNCRHGGFRGFEVMNTECLAN